MVASDHWSAYARLQTELDKRLELDDIAWGLEAGLNDLLTGPVDDVDRTVRSAARQARHRARLLRIESFAPLDTVEPAFVAAIDQSDALADVRSRLSETDWRMLRLRAAGYSYAAISNALGITAGALRVRFTRLKRYVRSSSTSLRRSA